MEVPVVVVVVLEGVGFLGLELRRTGGVRGLAPRGLSFRLAIVATSVFVGILAGTLSTESVGFGAGVAVVVVLVLVSLRAAVLAC